MSRAYARWGPEEYSTTRPHTGVIHFRDGVDIRVTDLPGIYEGANEDITKGRRVLRQTYRAKVLCYVLDMSNSDMFTGGRDAVADLEMLRKETNAYTEFNEAKPWMVIGTKCDMLHRDTLFNLDSLHFRTKARYGTDVPVVGTSARFGLGIERVVSTIRQLLYPDLILPLDRVLAGPMEKILIPQWDQFREQQLIAAGAGTEPPRLTKRSKQRPRRSN
mmetsp:Transcript_7358/g.15753  ORF Transcript_7358/g.15753 Transcript_7358/m.15753 type:complete len:218 (+) Transcript_7358:1-654(+)